MSQVADIRLSEWTSVTADCCDRCVCELAHSSFQRFRPLPATWSHFKIGKFLAAYTIGPGQNYATKRDRRAARATCWIP